VAKPGVCERQTGNFQVQRTSLVLDGSERSGVPLQIVLSLAPLQSDVTVTAQRGMVEEIDRTPPVVTVRTADDTRRRPLATTGNMLDGAPGVMVQQSTYGQASPFLRGLTGYQVLNLIDGIRFNNATFHAGPNQYRAFVDPSQLQRVEVMLGPASSQFGSDAMGGTIQVLTPAAGFNVGPGSSFSGRGNLLVRAFGSE
jgi:outer membrane cobalamin receptor